ncbi:MAG: hypothetical protein AAF711_00910 [Planctomycetota bacterium]
MNQPITINAYSWRLTKALSLAAAVWGSAWATSAQAEAEPVYRETFPVATDSSVKLTDAGWKAWLYTRAEGKLHRGAAGYTPLLHGRESKPADATPLNAETDPAAPATGMLVNWNRGDFWLNPTLYFTDEFTLDNTKTLTQVSWFQNNQDERGGFRVALRIGPDWYVSSQNFIGFGTRRLALANATWLPFDAASLEPAATDPPLDRLPDGPLTAFGVFGIHTGYAELDTFTLYATPAE